MSPDRYKIIYQPSPTQIHINAMAKQNFDMLTFNLAISHNPKQLLPNTFVTNLLNMFKNKHWLCFSETRWSGSWYAGHDSTLFVTTTAPALRNRKTNAEKKAIKALFYDSLSEPSENLSWLLLPSIQITRTAILNFFYAVRKHIFTILDGSQHIIFI